MIMNIIVVLKLISVFFLNCVIHGYLDESALIRFFIIGHHSQFGGRFSSTVNIYRKQFDSTFRPSYWFNYTDKFLPFSADLYWTCNI